MAEPSTRGRTVPGLQHLTERTLDLLECVPLSIHLLLFRLAIASVFLPAGFLKLASWESTMALFQRGDSGYDVRDRMLRAPDRWPRHTPRHPAPPRADPDHPAVRLPAGLARAPCLGRDLALPADSGSRNCFARPVDQSLAGTARLARGHSVSPSRRSPPTSRPPPRPPPPSFV